MTAMRLVVSSGTRTWGGLESMAVELATGLRDRGHDVVAFCRRGSPVHDRLQGRVPCEPILRGDRFHPGTVARCLVGLRRIRPDAVIGNTPKDPGWTDLAARALGIPYLFRHEFNRGYGGGTRDRICFGWVPAAHVVNSRSSRETLLRRTAWLPPERVHLIPNGIRIDAPGADAPPADLPSDATVFGFVGRLEESKGVRELVEAWPTVARAVPRALLALAGWGAEEGWVRDRLGGRADVRMLGLRPDMPALMRRFDVLVAPFHNEGFGLVLVEAMAAQTPVIAADTTSLPEIVTDGVEGRLVPPRDPVALARAMVELGSDPQTRARLGRAARARAVRDFSLERMLDAHEALLAKLLRGRPGTPAA